MNGQISAAEKRLKSLKTRLAESQLALEKVPNELSMTKAKLWVETSVVQRSLRAKKTRVRYLECQLTTEVQKRQLSLTNSRETSKIASLQLADGEDSFQDLQSKVVTIAAQRDEWYHLANDVSDKLQTFEADVALQSSLREDALEKIDAHTAEMV